MVARHRHVGYWQRMEARPPSSNKAVSDLGDFYVEPDCCLLCGVPEDVAPEVFHTGDDHCSVIRQPCSRDEIDRTIRAMWSCEVDCVRYRGRDATILERLARAGMAGQADHGDTSVSPIRLRNQVSFEMPEGAGLMDARQVAEAFRGGMRAEEKKSCPPRSEGVPFGCHGIRTTFTSCALMTLVGDGSLRAYDRRRPFRVSHGW